MDPKIVMASPNPNDSNLSVFESSAGIIGPWAGLVWARLELSSGIALLPDRASVGVSAGLCSAPADIDLTKPGQVLSIGHPNRSDHAKTPPLYLGKEVASSKLPNMRVLKRQSYFGGTD